MYTVNGDYDEDDVYGENDMSTMNIIIVMVLVPANPN